MELLEAIRKRTCTRSFKDKSVEKEKMDKILEAAVAAPNAGNEQSWEFIIIKDEEQRRNLWKKARGQSMISKAPVVIVACANLERAASRYGKRGRNLYSVQDCAAATENILLAAHGLGLGACWIGSFDEEGASEALGLPENVRPLTIIPIGHPAKVSEKPKRKPIEEVVHEEKY